MRFKWKKTFSDKFTEFVEPLYQKNIFFKEKIKLSSYNPRSFGKSYSQEKKLQTTLFLLYSYNYIYSTKKYCCFYI